MFYNRLQMPFIVISLKQLYCSFFLCSIDLKFVILRNLIYATFITKTTRTLTLKKTNAKTR